VNIGLILTDSWLMPGRLGTTGVALATAGFYPIQDERGKADLFGNPMLVTRRGIADTIVAAAELVMGERDEATPVAIVRNTGVALGDFELSEADVSIPWTECIYVQSLTEGRLVPTVAPGD
jgi:F420-0:gamma-glutamyl ligase